MNTPRTPGIRALALALALAPAAAAVAREPPCGCWYRGYEDGLEFSWDNRHTAENYAYCSRGGALGNYEAGFKAAAAGAERVCPYVRPKPKDR